MFRQTPSLRGDSHRRAIGAALRSFLAAVLVGVASLDSLAAATPPTLRTIAEARRSTRDATASSDMSAVVEGVVTLAETRWQTWVINDGTEGITFAGTGIPTNLVPGTRVRIEGTVKPGHFAPVIATTNVVVLGPAPLPVARRGEHEKLVVGAEDSQWIELLGVIRHSSDTRGVTRWNVAGELGNFDVLFAGDPIREGASWIGSRVRLRGTCLSEVNARGQFSNFQLIINRLADVEQLDAAPSDPFSEPVRSVDRVLRFSPAAETGRFVHVIGVVTWSIAGQPFHIQEGEYGITVEIANGEPPPVGSRVEVVGFPSARFHSPSLEFSRFRILGNSPLPRPRLVDLRRLGPADEGLRVTTEAMFADQIRKGGTTELELRSESGRRLSAQLTQPPDGSSLTRLEPGSRLRITGVYSIEPEPGGEVGTPQLLINSIADITPLGVGPWWSIRRATTAASALLLVIGGTIAWTATLRRRLSAQRRLLEAELAQRLNLERRHRELTEGAPDGIFTLDGRGRILSANPAAVNLVGYGEEELKRMTIFDILPAEERARAAQTLGTRFAIGGASQPFIIDIVGKTGRRRTIEVVSQVVTPPDAEPCLEGVARDITERRRAERALSHLVSLTAEGGGERFFRTVTRHTAEVLGVDHVFVAAYDPATPHQVQTLALFSHGHFAPNTTYLLADTPCETVIGNTEKIYTHDLERLFPTSEYLRALKAESYIGLPLWGDGRRPLGILSLVGTQPFEPTHAQLDMLRVLAARIGSEIERIRASEALRASEERFRELAEQGDDILWVFDVAERRLAYLGPSFSRLTGVDADACRHQPIRALRLMERGDRRRWMRAFINTLRSPSGRYSIEYKIILSGGTTRWILDQGVVIRDAGGQAVRVSGVARDITARKEVELALAGERARFRDLFENSPNAVIVQSREGVVLDVNRAACQLHFLSREDLVGRKITELVPDRFRLDIQDRFENLVSGQCSIAESFSLRSDGTVVPVEFQATRILHEGQDAILIHIHNLSARREAEQFFVGQKRILEWIATARPMNDILAELVRVTEARTPGMLCWVHWRADENLPTSQIAGPSLDSTVVAILRKLIEFPGDLARRLQVADGQPLIMEHPFAEAFPQASPADRISALVSNPRDRQLIAIPVLDAHGNQLGSFGALLPPDRLPSGADIDILRLSASLARVALERHRLDAALLDGAECLRAANLELFTLARSEAVSRGDLAAALDEITRAAARSARVDHVSVWLLDESDGLLRRLHGFSPTDAPFHDPPEYRLEELPFYIDALTRERLVSASDVNADPRFAEVRAIRGRPAEVTSRIDVGIRLRGRMAGCVVLEHEGSCRTWKMEEKLVAGSLADIVAMALQASERRCIEEALRQSEEAYRSVLSALAEGVMLINRNGAFLAYNDSAPEILGIPTSEFTSRNLGDSNWDVCRLDGSLVAPDDYPAAVTLRTGKPLTDSVLGIRRIDGEIAWISVNTRPFARDDDGQVISAVVSFTDITRRQRAERAMSESHELVRAISEVQASFIADADPARNVERMLSTLVQMTCSSGGAVAEVVESADTSLRLRRFDSITPPISTFHEDFLLPDSPSKHPPSPTSTAEPDGRIVPDDFLELVRIKACAETRSTAPAGSSKEEKDAAPTRYFLGLPLQRDDQVVGVVALYREGAPYELESARQLEPLLITCANLVRAIRSDRKRQEAEARIRQLNAELEQRVEQRTAELRAINQELAEFAYVVTHDLKAPLRGIHQLSEWMSQDHASQLDSGGLRLLALLRQRVLHLQRLVDGLLACARVGRSPEPQSQVATRDLVRQVISVLAPPAHIRFETSSDLPVVEGNPERLHQIFQNLLDNSVKYLDKPEGVIRITAFRDSGAWQFTVADNGPGIPKRYREKVFQIFQRLHQDTEIPGTGLGLTLVKRIVEARGGRIWIDPDIEDSTTIHFTWPDHARERPVT